MIANNVVKNAAPHIASIVCKALQGLLDSSVLSVVSNSIQGTAVATLNIRSTSDRWNTRKLTKLVECTLRKIIPAHMTMLITNPTNSRQGTVILQTKSIVLAVWQDMRST